MKKQMNFIDIAIPTLIMGLVTFLAIAAFSFSGSLFSSNLLSLPSINQNLEARGFFTAADTFGGTPQFVNEALEQQYAPVAVTSTPQFVNEALQQQYAPVAAAGTPQFVNEALVQQYAPVAASGTPQFVNEALQQQYAPTFADGASAFEIAALEQHYTSNRV